MQAGLDTANAAGLPALAAGSAGDAVRLLRHGGLALYASLVQTFDGLPNANRTAVLKLADSCCNKT